MTTIPDDIMIRAQAALCFGTEGSLTIGQVRDLVPVVARAIMAERERCATVAEEFDVEWAEHPQAYAVRKCIAAAIRRGATT